MKMTNLVIPSDKAYYLLLNEVKNKIISARLKAIRRVNKALIKLYWEIGRLIIEKQKENNWGKSVVSKLSKDLQRSFYSAKGYSVQNLWYMRQFYLEYRNSPKLQQLVGEIPWGHNILILSKIKGVNEKEYYIRASAELGWSRNVLLNQIKAHTYQKQKIVPKQHNFPIVLSSHLAEQADESMKSVYNLDFLEIAKPVLERELEAKLVERIKRFILELGYGFSFIGNQYRLLLGENEYYIDLLFFNRKIKCLVAIELKTGKFEPEYAGKMDFYLNLLNDQVKLKNENPAMGIILCAEKDHLVVEYALRNSKNPIGVSAYHLTTKLPRQLKGAIPSEIELKNEIIKGLK